MNGYSDRHWRAMKGVLIGAGYFAQFQIDAWKRIEARLASEGLVPSRPEQGSAGNQPAGKQQAGPALLAAVADVAPGKAAAFAARHGIPRAYDSVEAMLDEERPDFVDIATRPESHPALTRLAAGRGLHVICQKPMAPILADGIAMCEACESAGVRLLIHENWRWQPWHREARRLLAWGELGALRHASFDWRTGDGTGSEPYAVQPYFRRMPRLLVYESLVHILDTFRCLGGELRVTACKTRRVNPIITGEDWAEIRVAFDGGATGFIHGDRHTGAVPAPVAMGELRLQGAASTLRVAGDGHMFLSRPGAAEERLPFTPPGTGYKGDSVLATQSHLLECLATGAPCESEGREYLKTVALVEDCYRLAAASRAPGIDPETP